MAWDFCRVVHLLVYYFSHHYLAKRPLFKSSFSLINFEVSAKKDQTIYCLVMLFVDCTFLISYNAIDCKE